MRLRRERLIRAAMELYASEGLNVPMDRIAERAEVGRSTLYRIFPDRAAVSAAVTTAMLDGLATHLEALGDRDDAFFEAIRAFATLISAMRSLERMREMEQDSQPQRTPFRDGVEQLLAEPLARAKAAGLVDSDFALSDVHAAALMVAGGALDTRGGSEAAALDRALGMLISGLRPKTPPRAKNGRPQAPSAR